MSSPQPKKESLPVSSAPEKNPSRKESRGGAGVLSEDTPDGGAPSGGASSAGGPSTDHLEYEEAFDQTGCGRFNCIATLACSLIFIHSTIEMVGIAYVITPAECDLKLSVAQKSMVNSSVFIGIMVTSICWGMLGDLYGRRLIMLPTMLIAIITSFVSSLCTGFWVMVSFRFLTGCLISATNAMALVYLAELQNNAFRDRAVSIAISCAQFCFVIIPGIAWAIIPGTWSFKLGSFLIRPWRVFMWLWGIVGLVAAVFLFLLPESPRYILSAKGPAKAVPILAKIFAWNKRTTADKFTVKTIDVRNIQEGEGHLLRDLAQLMKAPMRRCVVLTHLGMFIAVCLSNGMYIWLPDFLNGALEQPAKVTGICGLIGSKYTEQGDFELASPIHLTNWSSQPQRLESLSDSNNSDCSKGEVNSMIYPISMGMEFFYLLPFVTVIIIIDKFNKVWLYAIIMFISTTGLLLSSFMPLCILAFGCLVVGLACGSCCCILTALAVDAFPTSLRGLATCTMFMFGQFGAVVGTSVLAIMKGSACYIIFALLAVAALGSAFSLLFLWPNLKDVRKIMEGKDFTY